MGTQNYDPTDDSRWSREQITVEEYDGEYGTYVQIETPRYTHSFALIDGTVVAKPNVDESVLQALGDEGYRVSL